MKQCKCKTNAILFIETNEITNVVCLKCKEPYLIKSTDAISIKMPIKVKKDGNCEAEIVWNVYNE